MASPLLETKLHVPQRRRGLVARPRLSERLRQGAGSKLTLLSAPAGFGKTTLLADWLAAPSPAERVIAWLSLDAGDNHAASFWPNLIAALQRAIPGVGAQALSLLEPPQPPILTVLATLLNDLSALPNDIVLVFDDYHLVDEHDIQEGMTFLLDHLPPRLHVVIATRADPALPLALLRARGELVEIRAAALRFTPDEAAKYLNEVMDLALTAGDVAALEARTEGWIAALQLAALSMQGRDDPAGFIAGFAGDDRYIVDYLAEEVLQRQPEPLQRFLLETSLLDRLSGPLCDAVTGHAGGKATLEALDRGNLFVIALDDRRRWYRYHQLFADVLRARLLDEQPDRVPELHRRASDWYRRNGEPHEAIRHALAARDLATVADLAELALPDARRLRQVGVMLGWLDALPDDLLRHRPVLSVGFAWALLEAGRHDRVEARLRDAERWVGTATPAPDAGMVVLLDAEFRELPATIALYRAALCQGQGDVAGTRHHAGRVLDLAGDDDDLRRGSALTFLGLASWTDGDLETAHRMFAEGMARVLRGGYVSNAISGAVVLADFRVTQGRLRDADRTYERAFQLATEHGEPFPGGTADLYVGLSELQLERGDLQAAERSLLTSSELGERTGWRADGSRWGVAMARIKQAQGDMRGALDLLSDAERLDVRQHFFPVVRPVAAWTARAWVASGNLAAAAGWAREAGVAADDDVRYVREFEHITLARLLLARGATSEALGLLERLLIAADQGGRSGSAVELLVLLAIGYQTAGEPSAALASLERALTLAEPEGYVRVFVDEGRSIADLLEAAANQGIAPDYVRLLVSALRPTDAGRPPGQGLVEPLSTRELEVLRLLATDQDGPDIARGLVVSLHTVRSHTKSIYAKLGVTSRRAAVRRAEELELLSRGRH